MDLDRAPKIVFSRFSEPHLKDFFDQGLRGLPFAVDRQRLWKQLKAALYHKQRAVLLFGIEADLALFSIKKLLYRQLGSKKDGELKAVINDAGEVAAFDPGDSPPTRNHKEAYQHYFKKILKPGNGVDAFMSRNPRVSQLLTHMVDNFSGNLKECLSHLAADQEDIKAVFLNGGSIKELKGVTHIGTNPRNGGRQTLLLDFAYEDKQGENRSTTIVYKPSDVEMDYLLAGRNTSELSQLLKKNHADAGYPFVHVSLFELLERKVFGPINEQIIADTSLEGDQKKRLGEQLTLPTYVVLPRNPGSRLQLEDSRLPVDTSYGYLEYLAHDPQMPAPVGLGIIEAYVRKGGWKFRDPKPQEADWIIAEPLEAFPCFRLWGRLMTVACVFLQTDLHFQHQIIRRRKPHLVDFENGLVKACATPLETLIAGNLRTTTGAPEVIFEFTWSDGDADLPVRATPIRPEVYRLNQMYLRQAENDSVNAKRLSPDDPSMAAHMKLGIGETLRGMQAIREEIAHWIQAVSLADVVVRHVVRDTPTFTAAVHQLVDDLLKDENRMRTPEQILATFIKARYQKAVDSWTNEGKNPNNPYYALEIPQYNGNAFENLEVPIYYRRVGSKDLLTARGETVTYQPQAGDDPDLRFDHYHREKGVDLLADSLLEKCPSNQGTLQEKIKVFVDSVCPQKLKLSDYGDDQYSELTAETAAILLPTVEHHAGIKTPGVVVGWPTELSVTQILAHLADAWPLHYGNGRVAVFLIDMDKDTAKKTPKVVEQQIKILKMAKQKKLDIFEIWTAKAETAPKLREVIKSYQKCHRINKRGGGSCFSELEKDEVNPLAELMEDKQVGLALVMGFDTNFCVEASIFGNAAVPQIKMEYKKGFLDRGTPVLTSLDVLYPQKIAKGPTGWGYHFKPLVPPPWVLERLN